MFENQPVTVHLFVLFLAKVTFEVSGWLFTSDQSHQCPVRVFRKGMCLIGNFRCRVVLSLVSMPTSKGTQWPNEYDHRSRATIHTRLRQRPRSRHRRMGRQLEQRPATLRLAQNRQRNPRTTRPLLRRPHQHRII